MSFRKELSRLGIIVLFGASVFFVFAQPEIVSSVMTKMLSLCGGSLLAALFPFLVLSNLLFICDAQELLGKPFAWLARIVRIRTPSAGIPILLGCTGGFAPAAASVKMLYERGSLSAGQCSVLLPLCLCIGPSFLVNTLGPCFHSSALGWCLYLAQWIACIVCAFFLRLFYRPKVEPLESHPLPHSSDMTFPLAISNAAVSYLKLCGCVLFFALLSAEVTAFFPNALGNALSMGLEISSGCLSAAQSSPYGLYLCSGLISLLSVSALLQVRTLLPENISLLPFLLLRPLHMGISLLVIRLCVSHLPAQSVYSSLAPDIFLRRRIPLLPMLLLFLLLCRFATLLSRLTDRKSHAPVL